MTRPPSSAFIADHKAPRFFSIAPGRPFLADLAQGLIAVFGEDLPRAEIYLPTRRAARALGEAILEARLRDGVRASLLPRMRAIGDVDEEELEAFAGDAADDLDLPPAISATARTLALARLVAEKDKAFTGHRNWPAALAAAREIGRLLDSLYAEEIDLARIDLIAVGEHARHWDVSAAFLKIVTTAWPAFLERGGLCDPAWRRQRLISLKAARLLASPPTHPVVIAGTTASAPAVARLVAAVAAAPQGLAVLPGLDRGVDARAFETIEDAHPQAGLKALLKTLGRAPADILPWPGSEGTSPRADLLRLALRPADATDEWLDLIGRVTKADPMLAAARRGLALIDAETEDAEASIIAMLFRETLEAEGATAMLVTPDRNLARRVALKMRRWNVTVDDSGGVPLANTACGTFLRLVARFLDDPDDPVGALALIRHPLARLGLDEPVRRRGVDRLDYVLRGPRRIGGLGAARERERQRETPDESLFAVIAALEAAAGGVAARSHQKTSQRMRAHLAAAETLAGGKALWSGDDGAAAAGLLTDLLREEESLDAVEGARYAEIFDALVAGAVVRRRSAAHPRLMILGPLEARLLSVDHVILGGLNEGVWPQGAPADPFLSRAMRERIGLPSPERRIG
ncbi:MAG: double-strand break repair protein AddB, partial [Parvularculaceae bacterium]